MRQVNLSNTVTASIDSNQCYWITERHQHLSRVCLNREEASKFIDFVFEQTRQKLRFECNRCEQKFNSLKELVDHAEKDHKIHLRDFSKRLQDAAEGGL